jgi:hypothetical protein
LWAVAVVGVWLALVAGAVVLGRLAGRTVELCLFRRLTGLPCPTCGTTRGVLALLSGRPMQAWLHNPLVFTLLAAAAALLAFRVLTGRSLRLGLNRKQRAVAWGLLAAAIAANWLYLIASMG